MEEPEFTKDPGITEPLDDHLGTFYLSSDWLSRAVFSLAEMAIESESFDETEQSYNASTKNNWHIQRATCSGKVTDQSEIRISSSQSFQRNSYDCFNQKWRILIREGSF